MTVIMSSIIEITELPMQRFMTPPVFTEILSVCVKIYIRQKILTYIKNTSKKSNSINYVGDVPVLKMLMPNDTPLSVSLLIDII